MTEVLLMSFLTVDSKQKNQKENTENHSIFLPLKSQVYSRQASSVFLLFG